MPTEFGFRVRYEVVLPPGSAFLSLSAASIEKKDLLSTTPTPAARFTAREHYDLLRTKPKTPFAVAGARNVLANLRCVGYSAESAARLGMPPGSFAAVAEEHDQPGRPYHVLRRTQGRFVIDEFTPTGSLRDPQPGLDDTDWLFSGTPVLWDCEPSELFERIVTDAADHSHVWRLPRGRSPEATDASRGQWKALQDVFVATLSASRSDAATELTRLANQSALQREDSYLHSVWGVGAAGELIIVIAHGRLEEVGALVRSRGATRAICVENGGSCGFWIVDQDMDWSPQVKAPNFRPGGTAYAFFELPTARFQALPHSPQG